MNEAISVTKFNSYIKNIFDNEELLHNISIVGEVFGVSISRNVIYFSLKDENATLSCVCFYPNLISEINEGDQLIITGSPNYYVKGGRLSFNVVRVERQGQGKLYEEFLKMKEKLEHEGLFDVSRKKPLPKEIKRIGVITSREGAVIQDIKNVSWRRNPAVDIVLFNTKVQGLNAEYEIAHAIEVMGKYENIDVLVVARGGGSLEDLKAYNTEVVARSTYNCEKPIVSAVGHETDFTIIDFVSDLRAPTPSAAAELLTFNLQDKKDNLLEYKNRLLKAEKTFISKISENLNFLVYSLTHNAKYYLEQKQYDLALKENTLLKSNPLEILNKGYAKIEQAEKSLYSANDVDFEKNITVVMKDGKFQAKPLKE